MPRPLSHNGLIILKVKNSSPRETYAGLLWVCENNGFKPGWVFHKFIEIYGKKPRPLSAVEPVAPSNDLREYLGIMQNRWKQKKRREELKNGGSLFRIEQHPGS